MKRRAGRKNPRAGWQIANSVLGEWRLSVNQASVPWCLSARHTIWRDGQKSSTHRRRQFGCSSWRRVTDASLYVRHYRRDESLMYQIYVLGPQLILSICTYFGDVLYMPNNLGL
jgi:hypothetical protein